MPQEVVTDPSPTLKAVSHGISNIKNIPMQTQCNSTRIYDAWARSHVCFVCSMCVLVWFVFTFLAFVIPKQSKPTFN